MVTNTQANLTMVKSQLLPSGIRNKAIIDAFFQVPRHYFLPESKAALAYTDKNLCIGHNRYMLAPALFGTMLQIADIKKTETVLNIACGTGYSTTILAHLAAKVIALESNKKMASHAHAMVRELAIENAIIIDGVLMEGHKEAAPYDVIVINGSLSAFPDTFIEQLAEEGRIIGMIEDRNNRNSHMTLARKMRNHLHIEHLSTASTGLNIE